VTPSGCVVLAANRTLVVLPGPPGGSGTDPVTTGGGVLIVSRVRGACYAGPKCGEVTVRGKGVRLAAGEHLKPARILRFPVEVVALGLLREIEPPALTDADERIADAEGDFFGGAMVLAAGGCGS
jgi:hypothetical protein